MRESVQSIIASFETSIFPLIYQKHNLKYVEEDEYFRKVLARRAEAPPLQPGISALRMQLAHLAQRSGTSNILQINQPPWILEQHCISLSTSKICIGMIDLVL